MVENDSARQRTNSEGSFVEFYRNFVFTHNNFIDKDLEFWNNYKCRYIIYGKEIAPTTGTPHLQGYVELHKRVRFSTLKDTLPQGVHIEPRRGTQSQAIEYCKKSGDYVEVGEPRRQGRRKDYDMARYMVENKMSVQDAMSELEEFTLGTLTAYEKLQKYITSGGDRDKPSVTWIYGPGGSGKTKRAYELAAGATVYKVDLLEKGWFDGYDRHETVIIDDFCCNKDDEQLFKTVLAITDRYPLRVNIKGSTVWFTPKQIIFTSQQAPWEIWTPDNPVKHVDKKLGPEYYNRGVKLRQIMRRINRVEYFETPSDQLIYPLLVNVPEVPRV